MADKTQKKKKKKNAPKAEVRSEEKEHKPTADEPDEFVAGANRWAEALRPHATKIVVLVVLLVAVGVGFSVNEWMGNRKARAATTDFAEAVTLLDREVVEPDPDNPIDPVADPDAPKPFASRKARAEAVLAAVEGSGLDAPRSLIRARALMDAARFDDAARAYATAAKGLPPEAAVSAKIGIGYAYEAKAEATEDAAAREAALNSALDAFRTSQPAETGLRRDVALFHEARILGVMGKRDEAKAAFQKILDSHPDTTLKAEIESRVERLGSGE